MEFLRTTATVLTDKLVVLTVYARNDKGQVIIGTTGAIDTDKASTEIDRLMSVLGATQASVPESPKTPKKVS